MSGRQHHYLPQLIQRPFAYRQKGKQHYVHAHHRARGRFTPNTGGLGKELDFYGGPDNTSLDDAITESETALAEIVQAINRGDHVAAHDMSTLICALAFRTKSMRTAVVEMFPALLTELRQHFSDISRVRQDLIESLTDPKQRRRLIYEQIEKNMGRLSREQRAKAYGTLLPMWKNHVNQRGEQMAAEAYEFTSFLLEKLHTEADIIANGAYLNALAKGPTIPARAESFAAKFAFDILIAPPDEFFVLGDCGPVAIFTDGKPRLVLGAFSDGVEIEYLLLPVSPTRCIVGHPPTAGTELSVRDINRASASLSLEFFISDRDTGGDLDELRTSIGSLVQIDTEADIVHALLGQMD